jgi:hypothetical protein
MITQGLNPNMVANAPQVSSSSHAAKGKVNKGKGKATMPMDGPTYEGHSIPGASPAPHLSTANVQSVDVGFCKMQPSVVSATALHAPANDDVDL